MSINTTDKKCEEVFDPVIINADETKTGENDRVIPKSDIRDLDMLNLSSGDKVTPQSV